MTHLALAPSEWSASLLHLGRGHCSLLLRARKIRRAVGVPASTRGRGWADPTKMGGRGSPAWRPLSSSGQAEPQAEKFSLCRASWGKGRLLQPHFTCLISAVCLDRVGFRCFSDDWLGDGTVIMCVVCVSRIRVGEGDAHLWVLGAIEHWLGDAFRDCACVTFRRKGCLPLSLLGIFSSRIRSLQNQNQYLNFFYPIACENSTAHTLSHLFVGIRNWLLFERASFAIEWNL